MSPNALETSLQTIETQLDAASRALINGDVVEIERTSSILRDLSVQFSQLLPQLLRSQNFAVPGDESLKARLRKISNGLGAQRAGLLRRTVAVETALNTLIPTSRATGYSAQSARYGANARQSGAFKVLAA